MWLNFCLTSFRRIHHCLATVSEVSQWLSCTEQPKQSVLFISRKSLKSKIAKRCIFWMMLALMWNRRTASYGFQVLQRLESVIKRAREITIRTVSVTTNAEFSKDLKNLADFWFRAWESRLENVFKEDFYQKKNCKNSSV